MAEGIPEKTWLRFFNKFLDQIGTAFPALRGQIDEIKTTVNTLPASTVVSTFMNLVTDPMRDAIEQEDYDTLRAQWQVHPLLKSVDLWSHWDSSPEANKKILLNYLQQLLKQGSSIVSTGKLVTRETPKDNGVSETPTYPRVNTIKKYADEIIPKNAKFEEKKVVFGWLIQILEKMITDEHDYFEAGAMVKEIMGFMNVPPAYESMVQTMIMPHLAKLRAAAEEDDDEVAAVSSNV